MDSVALDDAAARVDTQRVLDRLFLEVLEPRPDRRPSRPREAQAVVVDAVVRVALPVAREADAVGRLLEAAVAHELGGQPALDALVHELDELAVEPGVDPALDLRGVDDDAGLVGLRAGARDGAGEDQPGDGASPGASTRRHGSPLAPVSGTDQGCLRTENA